MRSINADDLEDVVLRLNKEGWKITRNDYKALNNILFEFPTIEAEPVRHGEWYAYDRYSQWIMHYKCSECNAIALDSYKYCPYCGARMDGE